MQRGTLFPKLVTVLRFSVSSALMPHRQRRATTKIGGFPTAAGSVTFPRLVRAAIARWTVLPPVFGAYLGPDNGAAARPVGDCSYPDPSELSVQLFSQYRWRPRAQKRELARSEKSRVGKECRSRWSPYH